MEEITIPMKEYKELLIIKGKYEELKENNKQKYYHVVKSNELEEEIIGNEEE